eukprot:1155624-Amphidinium_carterae.1
MSKDQGNDDMGGKIARYNHWECSNTFSLKEPTENTNPRNMWESILVRVSPLRIFVATVQQLVKRSWRDGCDFKSCNRVYNVSTLCHNNFKLACGEPELWVCVMLGVRVVTP